MTVRELKDLIFECYLSELRKQHRQDTLVEDKDKENNMVFGEAGNQLPDATDQMLAKFPTLKHALVRLHSEQYPEFVAGVEWVSPKPTMFRVELTNGQNYTLKWLGKDFEANISGKNYYLGQLIGFQQALRKLSDLYQEGPISSEDEESAEEGPDDKGASGSGGGDFLGGGADFSEPGGEEESAEGGSENPESEGGEDMSNQDIDFEADDI